MLKPRISSFTRGLFNGGGTILVVNDHYWEGSPVVPDLLSHQPTIHQSAKDIQSHFMPPRCHWHRLKSSKLEPQKTSQQGLWMNGNNSPHPHLWDMLVLDNRDVSIWGDQQFNEIKLVLNPFNKPINPLIG